MQIEDPSSYASPLPQTTPPKEDEDPLLKAIREKGFSAFVKDLQKEKMEELRAKILRAMGLTEDDLEKMPAKQRAEIEKTIAERIRQQLAAETELNDDSTGKPQPEPVATTTQMLSGGARSALAPALLEVIERARDGGTQPQDKNPDQG